MRRASINVHRSHGLGSTRSPSNTRAQTGVVDRVSNIERWLFNRAIREPQRDTWLLKETAMKIRQAINKEIMGLWRIKIA